MFGYDWYDWVMLCILVSDQNLSLKHLEVYILCQFDSGRCLSYAESMGCYCEVMLVFEYL